MRGDVVADYQIYLVGSNPEAAQHVAPLVSLLDIRLVEPADVVRVARRGDLAIFFSEHLHRFRNTWFQLREAGCSTLYAIDGILEWRNAWETGLEEPACPWTMRPVLSDKVACIGPSQARVLESWGNRGKTEIVGVPRFDTLVARRAGKRRKAPVPDRGRRILVTTAKWPAYTPEQHCKLRQSLVDLHRLSISGRGGIGGSVEWVWRLTGGLADGLDIENVLTDTSGVELARVLESVDAVITTPSTVLLESMIAGLPVALLDYTNSPAYVPAAWQITASEQMPDVARQLLDPSSARMAFQKYLLSDALQLEVPAAERMAELCLSMIRIAHDCREAGRPVAFPEKILSPVQPVPAWNQAGTFPETNIDVSGTEEIAALVAENQRQLGVLQRRAELLENELARAADGFRKIASHPILGPLLKVRQTAIRFGNQIGQVLARRDESANDEQPETESHSHR